MATAGASRQGKSAADEAGFACIESTNTHFLLSFGTGARAEVGARPVSRLSEVYGLAVQSLAYLQRRWGP
jgi:hypothetical protein